MRKTKKPTFDWQNLRQIIKDTDKGVLRKVINACDDHTIFDQTLFTDYGLDSSVVNAFTETIKSGKTPKEQITDLKTGEIVKSMKGVYGFRLLEFIAETFGVVTWMMGRGPRADDLKQQLMEKFTNASN